MHGFRQRLVKMSGKVNEKVESYKSKVESFFKR